MNLAQAKKRATAKICVGLLIAIPALISTAISLLRMIYFRMEDGTQFGAMLARPFKNLVAIIYQHTQFLEPFWQHSPTPSLTPPFSSENYPFAAIYVLFFVGIAFLASGKKIFQRLQTIQIQIEDQLIAESIKGTTARSREEIESNVSIPRSSVFAQVHALYIAPIVTAIIVALILKFVFGF